ncbi:MAG: PTS system fructose subfamily IIA component [Deltaproteobacteria bacterium]|nr:MAG: PTS system fructose subfamily IIA component [Deltaproteobacteria bacterium]
MIGIVVVTHAGLADEIRYAAELILGPQSGVEAVSIDRDMSVEVAKEKLHQAVALVGKDGDGTMILTDLFGGTPTNISVELLQEGVVEIVTGVNLPMLIKGISARVNQNLDELAALLKDYGKEAIIRPVELLRSRRLSDSTD